MFVCLYANQKITKSYEMNKTTENQKNNQPTTKLTVFKQQTVWVFGKWQAEYYLSKKRWQAEYLSKVNMLPTHFQNKEFYQCCVFSATNNESSQPLNLHNILTLIFHHVNPS